ncbi:DUF7824 domain-containing protein [Kitasatospora sp. NPDC004240]
MSGGDGSTAVGTGAGAVGLLMAAVRAGSAELVPARLALLGKAERRECLTELKALRKQLRSEWSPVSSRQRQAVLVAGTGCHPGAAGAATWIAGRDFASGGYQHPALVEVLEQQDDAWQIEVITRLGARAGTGWAWPYFPLFDRVVRRTGCPLPDSEGYVGEWLRQRIWHRTYVPDAPFVPLVERLRADPLTPAVVPRVFGLAEAGLLDHHSSASPESTWHRAVATLAAEGVLDRAELLDGCLARLLRGGRPADQRIFLETLTALAPTAEEYAARARDLMAMLDGLSVVAGHAQKVLGELDEAGAVEPELLSEASATVLFRTEKKLVRAQLGLLDKAARRSPERAGAVVLAAAEAFGHPDPGLQERALALVARHLRKAGEAVLPELRFAAEGLNPAHHARAGELLGAQVGGDGTEEPEGELLPPAPVPRPLGEPLGTPEEVAEELSALLAEESPTVAAFERTLDGLVRHAHRDRAALAEALRPVLRVHPWNPAHRWWQCGPRDVLYVATAAAGLLPVRHLWDALTGSGGSPFNHVTVYGKVLAARLEEAAWRLTADRPPLLLATPTDATGALAPAVLVERLAVYEAAGARPGEADLNAALLRVAPTADPATLDTVGRLASPAGRRVAAWLREGGLPAQESERVDFAPTRPRRPGRDHTRLWWEDLRRVVIAQPGIGEGPQGPAGERLDPRFLSLLAESRPSVARARMHNDWTWEPTEHWAAMLPHHREELAARWLDWFADAADRDGRGAPRLLPVLAEAGGPAGLALHLALAYGLGARHTEDRAAAVDALLVLAARGDLDGALLGRELAELVGLGAVKPARLGAALRAAADTGAYGTVWSVLAAALPGLLAGEPHRGLGDVVAVAVDCARRSGARGPVEGVAGAAARPGSSRLVKEARVLREVLEG